MVPFFSQKSCMIFFSAFIGVATAFAQNHEMPETILVRTLKNNKPTIVAMRLEEYLKGVLPSEMPMQWPMESLKAQAVAARSYARALMRERAFESYHVDDSTNTQVFFWQNFSGASSKIREKIERAIIETQGEYLTGENGQPYKTYFHSDCGGSTEEPKFVWQNMGLNGTVKDDRCAINPLSEWHTEIKREELNNKLSRLFNLRNLKVSDITVGSRTDSQRIHELVVHFISDGQAPSQFRAISAQNFRRIFGFNRVKSTSFSMNLATQGLILKGRGHGHGAGMCQKGARFMALAGSKYPEILRRYYPSTTLKRTAILEKLAVSN